MVGWLAGSWPGGPRGEKSSGENSTSPPGCTHVAEKQLNKQQTGKLGISPLSASLWIPHFIRQSGESDFDSIYLKFKGNFSAKNIPPVYLFIYLLFVPSWMWQPSQRRPQGNLQRIHLCSLKRHCERLHLLKLNWFSTILCLQHKPQSDFQTGISLQFPSRGDSGMSYFSTWRHVFSFTQCFIIGEGERRVKRDVSVKDKEEKSPESVPLLLLFFSPHSVSLTSYLFPLDKSPR